MSSKIRHWLAHRLGWNYGNPESFWRDGRLWMGFRCAGCSQRTGEHDIDDDLPRWSTLVEIRPSQLGSDKAN
jgi:hypothetical protein